MYISVSTIRAGMAATICGLLIAACSLPPQQQEDMDKCVWYARAYETYQKGHQAGNEGIAKLQKNVNESLYQIYLENGATSAQLSELHNQFPKNYNDKRMHHDLYQSLGQCQKLLASPCSRSGNLIDLNNCINNSQYSHSIELLDQFRNRIGDAYMPSEKELFLSRTEGRTFCTRVNLHDFLVPSWSEKPNKECLYSAASHLLQAVQVTDRGVLVNSPSVSYYGGGSGNIFLLKGNEAEDNLVDGASIESGYFKYTGILSYESITGQRSVYTFERVVPDPLNGLLFYTGH